MLQRPRGERVVEAAAQEDRPEGFDCLHLVLSRFKSLPKRGDQPRIGPLAKKGPKLAALPRVRLVARACRNVWAPLAATRQMRPSSRLGMYHWLRLTGLAWLRWMSYQSAM